MDMYMDMYTDLFFLIASEILPGSSSTKAVEDLHTAKKRKKSNN
jgi:hypothetical protein